MSDLGLTHEEQRELIERSGSGEYQVFTEEGGRGASSPKVLISSLQNRNSLTSCLIVKLIKFIKQKTTQKYFLL